MWNKIESCLGFWTFVVGVAIIVGLAIGINFKIVAEHRRQQHPEVSKTTSSATSKTKILIWSWPNDDQPFFFTRLARRVRHSRRDECPVLRKCAFASHESKLLTADAVVIVGGKANAREELINATLSHQTMLPWSGRETSIKSLHDAIDGKTWFRLVRDPEDRARLSADDGAWTDYLISYLPTANIPLIEYEFDANKKLGERLLFPFRNSTTLPRVDNASILREARLVASIVNKCQTNGNREGYITELRKHVDVHVYGDCGAPCPGNAEEDCLRYLDRHYKFILVFESEVCQHYLSPRLLRVLHSTNLVPVVFGGVDYPELFRKKTAQSNELKTARLTIDALNQSPRALAHYLIHLSHNTQALAEYLKWKTYFKLTLKEWPCSLCENLRLGTKTKAKKHLDFNTVELCTTWPSLDFSGR